MQYYIDLLCHTLDNAVYIVVYRGDKAFSFCLASLFDLPICGPKATANQFETSEVWLNKMNVQPSLPVILPIAATNSEGSTGLVRIKPRPSANAKVRVSARSAKAIAGVCRSSSVISDRT